MQYMYKGFRDPIQKITGDAYRQLCGITGRNSNNMEGQAAKVNYELVDMVIDAEIGQTALGILAKRIGVHFKTMEKRARELGYDYDRRSRKWYKVAA